MKYVVGIDNGGARDMGRWGGRLFKPVLVLLCAVAFVCASRAQEAFDAEKVKALFAGSEWYSRFDIWRSDVTFGADGVLTIKASGWGDKDRVEKWAPSGPRSVSGTRWQWTISPDGKELYVPGGANSDFGFTVYYRSVAVPPEYPFLRETLAKPGIVWVQQGTEQRRTVAFNGELNDAWGENGVEKSPSTGVYVFGAGKFRLTGSDYGDYLFYLIQDESGERILCDQKGVVYKPELAQPGDPLPPQKMSRASSRLGGTSWCRMDGKGKVLTITFLANGTVSDSAFPNEKPEWDPYDNGSIRYKLKDGARRMTLSEDKKILVREDSKAREIWFAGRQPPRVSMTETRQLKETLADKSKAWVCWDEGVKTVYTFDDKTANVSISVDDGKPKVVRWESLCAGCIRVGDEAFMVEDGTLERVAPRLTLKQVARESVMP